jgi:hypothetical protein
MYSHLAKQFSGFYHSGGWFSYPSVRLRYGETWAVFTESNSRGPFYGRSLQMRIAWPHAGLSCELVSRPSFSGPATYFGMWPKVDVNEEIANAYEVFGEDARDVQQLLTSGVSWQIDRLAKLGPVQKIRVVIREGNILVEKPMPAVRIDLSSQFVQGALELYDQCMLAKAVGIQFLRTDEAQTLEHVVCKVCGDEIHEQMVVCRRCKTPHHLDCWEYTGACSVYGCRESRYMPPHAGQAAPPS